MGRGAFALTLPWYIIKVSISSPKDMFHLISHKRISFKKPYGGATTYVVRGFV